VQSLEVPGGENGDDNAEQGQAYTLQWFNRATGGFDAVHNSSDGLQAPWLLLLAAVAAFNMLM